MRVKLWYIYGYIVRGVKIVRDLFLHITPAPQHTTYRRKKRAGETRKNFAQESRAKNMRKKSARESRTLFTHAKRHAFRHTI